MFKSYGTVGSLQAVDQADFVTKLREADELAARAFGYGSTTTLDYGSREVKFLSCSASGDVYLAHYTTGGHDTCAVKIIQGGVVEKDGSYRPLVTRLA